MKRRVRVLPIFALILSVVIAGFSVCGPAMAETLTTYEHQITATNNNEDHTDPRAGEYDGRGRVHRD